MAATRLTHVIVASAAVLLGTQAYTQSAAGVDMQRLLNVDKLGFAFFVDLPTNQNIETTPLMIDGVLYVTLPWSMVMAVDAKTGKQLWLHDPKVAKAWMSQPADT